MPFADLELEKSFIDFRTGEVVEGNATRSITHVVNDFVHATHSFPGLIYGETIGVHSDPTLILMHDQNVEPSWLWLVIILAAVTV